MPNFTSADVMKLRQQTGVGMMDCKKALVEADGDFEKAIKYLREKGMASAAKKASRVAAEGLVKCVIADDKKSGVIVEINCETDFVARSEQFISLIENIGKHILSSNATTANEVSAEKYYADSTKTVSDVINEAIQAIGEKIALRRFVKYSVNDGYVASYIHMGGSIGVLTAIKTDASYEEIAEVAFNVCMQIAASRPTVISVADVDPSQLENEREILTVQAKNEGKPDAVIAKMVEGRINKYYKEVCLLEQPYVRDDSMAVKKVIADVEKQIGKKIEISAFVRYEMGEGIEKRVDNFAEEIAEQLNKMK